MADHGTRDVPGEGLPGAQTGAGGDRQPGGDGQPGGDRQTFRSPVAVFIWWVWLAFAVANLADLAVQGHDHLSVVAGAVLILVTGAAYVAALRPRVIADGERLTIRNPLREHRMPWTSVRDVDLGDVLRVHCEWTDGGAARTKVISAWAVQASHRRRMSSELRGMRPGFGSGGTFGSAGSRRDADFPGGYGRPPQRTEPVGTLHRKETERITKVLSDRLQQERSRPATGATGPAGPGRPASSWHWPSVAALVIPALLLIIAILA